AGPCAAKRIVFLVSPWVDSVGKSDVDAEMSMFLSERWRESALGSRVAAAGSCAAVSRSAAELRATTPLRADRVSAEVRRFRVSVRSVAWSASPARLCRDRESQRHAVLDLVAADSEEDDGADSEVSPHATPQPKPVRTAAPTPKPPQARRRDPRGLPARPFALCFPRGGLPRHIGSIGTVSKPVLAVQIEGDGRRGPSSSSRTSSVEGWLTNSMVAPPARAA